MRPPEPHEPVAPAPESALPARPNTDAPPLPRRERGASTAADEPTGDQEALDLFGGFDGADTDRSTLADFQRGQETARREARG